MKTAVFDIHSFEKPLFEEINKNYNHEITHFPLQLTEATAYLAKGFPSVCVFAHDTVNAKVLEIFKELGVKIVALRSAGYNHVDLVAAAKCGIKVVRVPAYSPHAIAEHAVALILALNRKIIRANSRVRELNFSLDDLVGFDLHGKNIGVIGAGKIGSVFVRIMQGFGSNVLIYDKVENPDLKKLERVSYCSLDEIYSKADIISLHMPLNDQTRYLINQNSLAKMKKGVMLINTSRGGLLDSKALIQALKKGQVGFAGLDVYEEEEHVFFHDLSASVLQDDILARLMTFPNVLITAHQAFLTHEALHNIVETTLMNLRDFEQNKPLVNEVKI